MEIVLTCNILYYKDSNSQTLHIQSQSAQLSKGCAQHALTPSPKLLVVVLPLFTQKKLRLKRTVVETRQQRHTKFLMLLFID